MGAWGNQTLFTLPERLPDPPKVVMDLPDIERVALAQRLDVRGARVARAESTYMQTLHRATETAVNARSEVREAHTGYRSAYDIAEENLLRYKGMFIGVFELLADARTQIGVVNGAIQALRDFWVAQADLDMALIGKPSLAAAAGLLNMKDITTKDTAMTDPGLLSRRKLLGGASAYTAAITAAMVASSVSKVAMAALPEPVIQAKPNTMPPLVPNTGRPYNPVVTLNGWRLPWRLNQGVKELHLVRRARGARNDRRLQGPPVGLQRPAPGADDRGRGRRPRAHVRHQQAW